MSIIELQVAREHLKGAAELYDNDDDGVACSLRIQMATAEALIVIANELRKLNDSLGSIDLNILRIEGAMPK